MGLTHLTVTMKGIRSLNGTYQANFLVDTGASDSMGPCPRAEKDRRRIRWNEGLRARGRHKAGISVWAG